MTVSDSRKERNKVFGGDNIDHNVPARNVMVDDFNWEVPVESVPVPSEGKVYPPDSPLHGRKTVNIKAMTAKEEDILSSRALIGSGTVILELLRSCIVDGDVSASDMLTGDRNALMVAVRITGYGHEYPVVATCPKCSNSDQHTFNLADMPIRRLSIDPVVPGDNCFEFLLPVTKKTVYFKFLTGRDNDIMEAEAEKMKRLFPESKIENNVTRRLRTSIISVDGVADRNKIAKFVENMPAMDSRKLRAYIENNEPGIEMSGKMNCNACGQESEVGVPLGASFFWPKF